MSRPIVYRNSVVLFSGGMDSTVALYHRLDRARREDGLVHVLTVNYGQRHHNEVAFARMLIDRLRADDQYAPALGDFVRVSVPMPHFDGSLLGTQPVTKYLDVADAERNGDRDNAFVPYRNLMLLTIAAQLAYQTNSGTIVTGLRGGFPDCTAQFEMEVQAVLHRAVPDYPVQINTPTHVSRADTLRLAQKLPGCMQALKYTLTCFEGTTPPCGHCLPCLKRAEGFAAIGVEDPILGPRYGALGPPDRPDWPL